MGFLKSLKKFSKNALKFVDQNVVDIVDDDYFDDDFVNEARECDKKKIQKRPN